MTSLRGELSSGVPIGRCPLVGGSEVSGLERIGVDD